MLRRKCFILNSDFVNLCMVIEKLEINKYEHEFIMKLHKKRKSYKEIAKFINRSKSTV